MDDQTTAGYVNNDLSDLLDSALTDFGFNSSGGQDDDDLDEFMAEMDTEATNRASQKFQSMINEIAEQLAKDEKDAALSRQTAPAHTTFSEGEIMKSVFDLLNNPASRGKGPMAGPSTSGSDAKIGGIITGEEKAIMDTFLKQLTGKDEHNQESLDCFMEWVIKAAISKEVMHPHLIDFHSKYGEFMSKNGDELEKNDPETHQRYLKQFETIQKIKSEYEKENVEALSQAWDKNTPIEENPRAMSIATLWLEMQKYGLPPPEIANSLGENSEELEKINAEGCIIM